MNEQIKELARLAQSNTATHFGDRWSSIGRAEFMMIYNQKFAELIVEDVLQLIATSDAKCRDEWDFAERDLYAEIQKHFGVK